MNTPIKLLRVLPDDVEVACEVVDRWIKTHLPRSRILHMIQPGAFFEPPPNGPKRTEDVRRLVLEGIISVAVVKGEKKSRLLFALLASDTPYGRAVASYLKEQGVPVYFGDLTHRTEIEQFLDSAQQPSLERISASTTVTNLSERWLITHTKVSLGLLLSRQFKERIPSSLLSYFEQYRRRQNGKFRIYHEISMAAVFAIDGFDDNKIQKTTRSAARFRFDVLIASAPPESLPILVVEFDGPHHSEKKQRDKDEFRDQHLDRAGIPVLRISYQNDVVPRDSKITPISYQITKERRELVISLVVNKIAEHIYMKRVEQPRVRRPYYAEFKKRIEEEVEKHRVEKARINIGHDELNDILERVADDLAYFSDDTSVSEIELDIDERDELRRLLDPTNYNQLGGPNGRLVDVSVEQNAEAVIAKGTLHAYGEVLTLETPLIYVKLRCPREYGAEHEGVANLDGKVDFDSSFLSDAVSESVKILLNKIACDTVDRLARGRK